VLADWQEDPSKPVLFITHTPPIDSHENLRGVAIHADPDLYAVAVYILVQGNWWTKPTFSAPLTPLQPDKTWTTDITTGGADPTATRIAAFLVPVTYTPPQVAGLSSLPDELTATAVAYTEVERIRPVKELVFAGRTWWIKEANSRVGPGPNLFSADHAWVDTEGALHLKIDRRDGRWRCAEVVSQEPLGYGRYTFHLASRVDQLDANVVLGLFTWDDDPAFTHREIDIELSRWGDPANEIGQFVIQPFQDPSRIFRFPWTQAGEASTHWFDWRDRQVSFGSHPGQVAAMPDAAQWQFTGPEIPPPGPGTNARMNLWLLNGQAPLDEQAIEVVVSDFQFEPAE